MRVVHRKKVKYLRVYKLFRLVSHPLVLIVSFLMAPVSSMLPDGWVINYFVTGIINQDAIIVLPLSGITLLLLNWKIFKRRLDHWLEGACNVIGIIILFVSYDRFMHVEPKLTETYSVEEHMMIRQWLGFVLVLGCQVFYYSFYKTFGWDILAKNPNNNKIEFEDLFTTGDD